MSNFNGIRTRGGSNTIERQRGVYGETKAPPPPPPSRYRKIINTLSTILVMIFR